MKQTGMSFINSNNEYSEPLTKTKYKALKAAYDKVFIGSKPSVKVNHLPLKVAFIITSNNI